MTSIWVIEQGSYSDYHVVGVFSTKANAELALSRMKPDDYADPTIDEWPLDPSINEINMGLTMFWVNFDSANNITSIRHLDHHDPVNEDSTWRGGSHYSVFAADQESAIKIATERHFQRLAEPKL